jgi:hypothetical protein
VPRRSTLLAVLPLCLAALVARAAPALADNSVKLVAPDAYTCGQTGSIDFEELPDGTDLSAASFPGVEFTTTNGFTWRVGDFATGNYNGKYPNGAYTSHGTHWAWLGTEQGAGRIDLTTGRAKDLSVLVSAGSTVSLDAYNDAGTLLETAGPSPITTNTDKVAELRITRTTADIGYVVVHDSGNFFLIDMLCSDARGVGDRDADGDGLADDWERNGADTDADGTVDLDLPAMGADPNRKDLFVEVDWLTKDPRKIGPVSVGGGFDARPSLAAVKRVSTSFNAFPVPNPAGSAQGVNVHLDAGRDSIMNAATGATWGGRSRANAIRNGLRFPDWKDWGQMDTFRAANVDRERRGIFHYVLYVDEIGCASGGCTTGWSRGIPGHDLVIAKGDKGIDGDTQEAVTLAHELGHNLGLGHGGRERTDDPLSQYVNNKANYLSIMNYYFSSTGLKSNSGFDGILSFSPQEHATLLTSNLAERAGLDPDPFAHLQAQFKCSNDSTAFSKQKPRKGDTWAGIDWGCDGTVADGSSNTYLQNPDEAACVFKIAGVCQSADTSRVRGSEDYHHFRFWGIGQGWDSRNVAIADFEQPGTSEPTIEQAKADGVWYPDRALTVPGSVEIAAYPGTGVVDVPLLLENRGASAFALTTRIAVPAAGLGLPGTDPVTLAAGARQPYTLSLDTGALSGGTDVEADVEYVDDVGTALGSTHVTIHVPASTDCDEARAARAAADLPPVQVPALDALLVHCVAAVPAPPAPPGSAGPVPRGAVGCVPPRTTRTVRVPLRGAARRSGVARVRSVARSRFGARASTTYRVKLTRGCATIATGTVKGRTLVLTVKSTGTKRVRRNGRRVSVKVYPRLKGRYVLESNGGRAALAPVAVTVR